MIWYYHISQSCFSKMAHSTDLQLAVVWYFINALFQPDQERNASHLNVAAEKFMKNLSAAWIMTNHPLWLGRTKVVHGVANVMNYYPWDRQHFAATIGLTIIAPESHSLWIAILLFTNCLFEPLYLINIQTIFQNSKHPLSDQVPDKDKSWPKMSNLVSHIFPLHLHCTAHTDWGKGWKNIFF